MNREVAVAGSLEEAYAAKRLEVAPRTDLRGDACAGVLEGLRRRQSEIGEALYARVRSISGPVRSDDVEYQVGLRAAVTEIVDYCLAGFECGEERPVPIPAAAIAQARRAARGDVSVDTLVRRYIAGHRLLGEYVMDEFDGSDLSNSGLALRQLRRIQESLLERLTARIVNEYNQERERITRSPEHRRRELVQSLLAGETVDASELDYMLDAWHLGMIATGVTAERAMRRLADGLGCQLLAVAGGDGALWTWLGARRRLAVAEVERLLAADSAAGISLAVGEPARGIAGWRQTHREAQAALVVALHRPRSFTRCSDVLLEAAVLRHDALACSLVRNYLAPLENLRIGGQKARETLHAYFVCDRNVSAAAHFLGVARNTVESRLRDIERCLGRMLPTCVAELEVALRLESLPRATPDGPHSFPSI